MHHRARATTRLVRPHGASGATTLPGRSTTIYLVNRRLHDVAENLEEVDERFRAAQPRISSRLPSRSSMGGPSNVKPSEIAFFRTGRG